MGTRYNKITNKNPREIVLLRSFPCKYGKCSFCNYILDNSNDENAMIEFNHDVLSGITGEFGMLEVINSGSVFELPQPTINEILSVAKQKNIHTIYFEIYYGYMRRLEELKKLFNGIAIRFKMGLETFDNEFRINTYNKHFSIKEDEYENIAKDVYSICLMNCVEGQTKEMIKKDIELGLKYFQSITVNMFIDNGTKIKSDPELAKWFTKEYAFLQNDPRVEMLTDNKDLGVFEQ